MKEFVCFNNVNNWLRADGLLTSSLHRAGTCNNNETLVSEIFKDRSYIGICSKNKLKKEN